MGLCANPDDAVEKLITISDIALELMGSNRDHKFQELVKTKLNVAHSLSWDPKQLYSSEPEVKKVLAYTATPPEDI